MIIRLKKVDSWAPDSWAQGPNCPGPSCPGAQLFRAQDSLAQDSRAPGPNCPGSNLPRTLALRPNIIMDIFYICVCQIEWRYTQIADVCCHLSISYSNQPTSVGYIANLMHRSTHDAQSLQFRIGDAKISDEPTQNANIPDAPTHNAKNIRCSHTKSN